jgi:hypothetical protein
MTPGDSETKGSRAGLIETIRTPLGFFALVVLVAEALLALAASVLRDDVDPVYVLAAMFGLILFLVLLVAGFAFFRPEALHGRRFEPRTPAALDVAGDVERLGHPAVLCVSLEAESKPHLEEHAALIARLMSDVVMHPGTTLESVHGALTGRRDTILHVLGAGALSNDATRVAAEPASRWRDALDAAGVRLLVLVGCDSIDLASELARVANIVVVPTGVVRHEFAQWTQRFYEAIARGASISRAYTAASTVGAPIMLILSRDAAFRSTA